MIHFKVLSLNECNLISNINRRESIFNIWEIKNQKWIFKYSHFEIFDWEGSEQRQINTLKAIIKDGGKIFSAFDDDKLIGYAALERRLFGPQKEYLKMESIFISSDYRKNLIASTLLSFCEIQARCWKAKKLYIVSDNSENCVKFFMANNSCLVKHPKYELSTTDHTNIHLEIDLYRHNLSLSLSKVCKDNLVSLSKLNVTISQKKFYPISNLAWLTIDQNNPKNTLYSIEISGYPVGLIGYIKEESENIFWINPFMIDASFQNKKIGQHTLKMIINLIQKISSEASIKISLNKNNYTGKHILEKHNFFLELEGDTNYYFKYIEKRP